jgi:hypothetical protein
MGLLDDAIREHLELKRRHGADPNEVARQEREALGGARRGEFAAPDGERAEPFDDGAEAAEGTPETGVAAPESAEPAGAAPEGAAAAEVSSAAPEGAAAAEVSSAAPEGAAGAETGAYRPPERPDEPGSDTAGISEPEDVDVAAGDEIAPPEREVPERGREASAPGYDEDPWIDEDRDEVPAEESLDRPAGEQTEDVLEETPEFLQETPEHERLWFEQRPPRDFDWDK